MLPIFGFFFFFNIAILPGAATNMEGVGFPNGAKYYGSAELVRCPIGLLAQATQVFIKGPAVLAGTRMPCKQPDRGAARAQGSIGRTWRLEDESPSTSW